MTRRPPKVLARALLALGMLAACGSDDPKASSDVSTADAYNAAIRWFLSTVPAPTDTTDVKPTIVYIAPASGNAIDVQTQADVAAEMADMEDVVVVRFADVGDDALDVDVELEPVKEGGVLLLVGDVTEGPPPIDLDVGVYHDAEHQKLYSIQITRVGETFVASTVTEIEQG